MRVCAFARGSHNLVDRVNVSECDFHGLERKQKTAAIGGGGGGGREELGVPRRLILSVCKETWPRLLKKDVAEQDGRCCDQGRCGEING